MARHDHDTHDDHAQDEERMNADLIADRERMFGTFVSFSAWNVVAIGAILVLLALTQT